jgi:hypothetical protein
MDTEAQAEPNLCRVTLVGPAQPQDKRGLLSVLMNSKPEWRRLIIEVRVGTERWPDWDAVNVCLSAMKDLVTLNEGYLTDEVVKALETHVDVVSYETFRGPPAEH